MKIFVPEFRYERPSCKNGAIIKMLVEVDRRDLYRIIDYWKHMDKIEQTINDCLLRESIETVCEYPIKRETLSPFLLRPHITVHSGAREPEPFCKEIFERAMYETGQLVAANGFNLWYGGGDGGLMGLTAKGFFEQNRHYERKDQYTIQIMPADFVVGVKSSNGAVPANEGLGSTSDAVIVLPDFVDRRELLDSRFTASITGPGGSGTLDELYDILVHAKTGLRAMHSYVLNLFIPEFNEGYYELPRKQIERGITCGMESSKSRKHIRFMETPQAIMEHLMNVLDETGNNPQIIYEINRRIYDQRQGLGRGSLYTPFRRAHSLQ